MKRYVKLLAFSLICLMLASCGGHTHEEVNESVKKGETEYTSDYQLDKAETEGTAEFNESGVNVIFKDIKYKDGVTSISYTAKNTNDFPVSIVSENASFNGFVCADSLNINLKAKDEEKGTFDVGNDWFSNMGIKRITDFELTLTIIDENSQEIAKSNLLSLKTDALGEYVQKYETNGTELYSENNIKIFSRDIKKSEHSNDTEVTFYVENNSGETVTVVSTDVSVNEKPISATYVSTLTPGKKSIDTLLLSENVLSNNEISEIEKLCANFKAYNENFEIVFETGILNIPVTKAN